MTLLSRISSPADLKSLPVNQLEQVCRELREFLIDSISQSSGHFASNLGTVELTVALHYVFDSPEDKLLWDVGHQAYAHKVLTGRREQMATIRHHKGLHPFPFRSESVHDILTVGHSSTSISAACGVALANRNLGKTDKVIPIIGDGALTAGMVFEALNHAGDEKLPMLIVFNDNNMSISANKGALNKHTDKVFNTDFYQSLRDKAKDFLPNFGPLKGLLKHAETQVKDFFAPEIAKLFEVLGVEYIGPVDGHNVVDLVRTFTRLKNSNKLCLLHVLTVKGKGYKPAEKNPIKYHGVGRFDAKADAQQYASGAPFKIEEANKQPTCKHIVPLEKLSAQISLATKDHLAGNAQAHTLAQQQPKAKPTVQAASVAASQKLHQVQVSCAGSLNKATPAEDKGSPASSPSQSTSVQFSNQSTNLDPSFRAKFSYSDLFGSWLYANRDDGKLFAVTPAMCEGSGMQEFAKACPQKFADVAIAEQHAVTVGAGLAIGGLKPVVAIYSTFLQRGFDQIVHDIAIDDHDCLFAIDRAGLVGEDGQTHHGAFDLSYLRCIPNLRIACASYAEQCAQLLQLGYELPGAVAVRYPRGNVSFAEDFELEQLPVVEYGKSLQLLHAQPNKAQAESPAEPKVAIVAFGSMVRRCFPVAKQLGAALYDGIWVKPLDEELVKDLAAYDLVVIAEENTQLGGAYSAFLEAFAANDIFVPTLPIALPDRFVEPIESDKIDAVMGWTTEDLVQKIQERREKIRARKAV